MYDKIPDSPTHVEAFFDELYAAVPRCRKLYVAQSATDATRVAYTQYATHRQQREAAKRGIALKPKRLLPKSLASLLVRECGLSEDKARAWQQRWALVSNPAPADVGITFTADPDEIERVYIHADGFSSCMKGRKNFLSPVHPARIYGNSPDGIVLAYYTCNGHITGRGVCVPTEKAYVRWYGEGESQMAMLGFSRKTDCLVGKRVVDLAAEGGYQPPEMDDRVIAPYVDGTAAWLVRENEYDDCLLTIREDYQHRYPSYNAQYATQLQHGWSCPEGSTGGYDMDDEDDDYVVDYVGNRLHIDYAVMPIGWHEYAHVDATTWSEYDEGHVHDADTLRVNYYDRDYSSWETMIIHDSNDTTTVTGLDYPVLDAHLERLESGGHIVKTYDGSYYEADHADLEWSDFHEHYVIRMDSVLVWTDETTQVYVDVSYIWHNRSEFAARHGELVISNEFPHLPSLYTLTVDAVQAARNRFHAVPWTLWLFKHRGWLCASDPVDTAIDSVTDRCYKYSHLQRFDMWLYDLIGYGTRDRNRYELYRTVKDTVYAPALAILNAAQQRDAA
jgi:hypothetical protein